MKKNPNKSLSSELKQQGADNLLAATFRFLRSHNVSNKSIVKFTKKYHGSTKAPAKSRRYNELQIAYEEMGVIMATWFSDPEFLDSAGKPVSISPGSGINSLSRLIRASRARIAPSLALELMSESPSIKFENSGKLIALRRVFVLPKMEVPRAAFVIERFLDTLQKNTLLRKENAALLLERSCHVSKVDLSLIGPLLRNIEDRGTAFMDLIDGEIEAQRLHRVRRTLTGEMGVLVFAWTQPANTSKKPRKSPNRTLGLDTSKARNTRGSSRSG